MQLDHQWPRSQRDRAFQAHCYAATSSAVIPAALQQASWRRRGGKPAIPALPSRPTSIPGLTVGRLGRLVILVAAGLPPRLWIALAHLCPPPADAKKTKHENTVRGQRRNAFGSLRFRVFSPSWRTGFSRDLRGFLARSCVAASPAPHTAHGRADPRTGHRGRSPRQDLQDRPAVAGISFALAPGSITGLLGGNGAGKTTTIAMIMGLVTPTSGTRDACSARDMPRAALPRAAPDELREPLRRHADPAHGAAEPDGVRPALRRRGIARAHRAARRTSSIWSICSTVRPASSRPARRRASRSPRR